MSSQAPRADERLPLVSQRREQHQQLGGGELSRLSTSKAIGAVAVEVQTEEELAVQAACGWEITPKPSPPDIRRVKKIRALGAREPGGGKRL